MTATYLTREGAPWELTDLRAHAFLPGFWWARRQGDQNLVCVHEHRMTFHETLETGPQEPAPAQAALCAATPPETSNPS